MSASSVAGYLAGHIFDSGHLSGSSFTDQAGYGNSCDVTVGTPSFSTTVGPNSRTGVLLDQTCQLQLLPPIPFEGTALVAFYASLASNSTSYPWVWGKNATVTNTPTWKLIKNGSTYQFRLSSAGGTIVLNVPIVNGMNVVAINHSQTNRRIDATKDGTTILSSSTAPSTTDGDIPATCFNTSGNTLAGAYARVGDLSGTGTSTSTSNCLYLCEQHFWKGDALGDLNLQAFFADRKLYYGA